MKRASCSLIVLLTAATADAGGVRYAGIHPLTGKPGGGLCYIESVHLHSLPPSNDTLYRQQQGVFLFIGDPMPYGYDGPKERYYGHHPVTVDVLAGSGDGTVYCYLDGPHWHHFPPPRKHKWEEKDDVYYYSGDYPPEYERDRPRYSTVNAVYRPLTYERPVVVTPPPPEYHGPVVELRVNAPPPPGVVVVAPPPPGVVVGVPRPPPPGVVIGVPHPPPPGVVLGVPHPPAPVVVVPHPGVPVPTPVVIVPGGHVVKGKKLKVR